MFNFLRNFYEIIEIFFYNLRKKQLEKSIANLISKEKKLDKKLKEFELSSSEEED